MEKMNGGSMDLADENIQVLRQLFPEAFTEGKIDFEKLKLLLGANVDEREERYELRWNGKTSAIKLAQIPTMGTLRPDKESSKNWDSTENLYIEGDNLEALKLLQKSYFGKIKMIYIDPPYNTGKDFVYEDNFRDNIKNYKEVTNQLTRSKSESNGRFHTDWLNMMYPRIKLARNLLKSDGVIFISIDENEFDNLKKMCDEILGEENFISCFTVVNNIAGRSDKKHVATAHEYLVMYQKSDMFISTGLPLSEEQLSEYKYEENGRRYRLQGLRKRGTGAKRSDRPNMWYQVYYNADSNKLSLDKDEFISPIIITPKLSDGSDGRWRWGKDTFLQNINLLEVRLVGTRNEYDIYEKVFLENDGELKTAKIKSFLLNPDYTTDSSTSEFKEFMEPKVFDNPKSIDLIKDLCTISNTKNDIILDFFSGSSTTAHAVMQLNAENGGNRKFIMIQLPELTDEKSEAYKAGYKTICEIGKERVRRAGEKIKEENKDKEGIENLDIGFKVFKLDDSNIKIWNPDYNELEQDLLDMQDSLKKGRTNEDLLFEIILKMGFELTTPIEEVKVGDKVIYNISEGALIICLEDSITDDILNKIPDLKSEFMRSDEVKVIFKEKGFNNDKEKMNAIENLKQQGINNVRSV